MLLITILLSLLLVQIWGSGKPLQKDHWFFVFVDFFSQMGAIARLTLGAFIAALVVSLVAVYFVYSSLHAISGWFAALFSVLIFVYAMGREQWDVNARTYISAWHSKDWDSAIAAAQNLDVNTYEIDAEDWTELNHEMVSALAYQGFERLFVILFWFCLGGVLAILAYRLIALYHQQTENLQEEEQLGKVLWLMEWPAVRLFGLSLAITGNFSSCFHRFRQFCFDARASTEQLLVSFVEAALSIEPSDELDPRCGERELQEILHLYSRTTVLWVCAIAVITIFF